MGFRTEPKTNVKRGGGGCDIKMPVLAREVRGALGRRDAEGIGALGRRDAEGIQWSPW